ncbi:hypothetical protein EYF80_006422 [Liparis tanakae]|uniref:Uncharacterized protein n=1 Tax=Liparis tanakae TaxID=230148 RepID=A0A4Z2J0H4_9TELE|nr:hypothetical protein EYF80_006422 [Liparis tanakae]
MKLRLTVRLFCWTQRRESGCEHFRRPHVTIRRAEIRFSKGDRLCPPQWIVGDEVRVHSYSIEFVDLLGAVCQGSQCYRIMESLSVDVIPAYQYNGRRGGRAAQRTPLGPDINVPHAAIPITEKDGWVGHLGELLTSNESKGGQ